MNSTSYCPGHSGTSRNGSQAFLTETAFGTTFKNMQRTGALRKVHYFTEVMNDRADDLRVMLDILRDAGADYTLIGGLAVGHHGYQRTTVDVDMLVHARFLKRIAKAARDHGYVVRTFPDMIRVYPVGSDEPFSDVVSADVNPVLRAAFDEADSAIVLGHRVDVVTRGPLCALKFHAAISPTREIEDKYQDIADVGHIVKAGFTHGDEIVARRVAALSYPGAGDDFIAFLNDLRHGRPVQI